MYVTNINFRRKLNQISENHQCLHITIKSLSKLGKIRRDVGDTGFGNLSQKFNELNFSYINEWEFVIRWDETYAY